MNPLIHVRHLSETIGPRGSTTPQEAKASRYAEEVFRQAGLKPVRETFTSARSAYYPYALFAGLLLIAEVLFWYDHALAALIPGIIATVSVLLELSFRSNPFRWFLPKSTSQNVCVKIDSREQQKQQVVLLGHLDTHRTPLLFSKKWVKMLGMLVPIGLVSAVVLLILFALGAIYTLQAWRLLSLPFSIIILGLFLIMIQADTSPFTAGANDNATGAAVVLCLAEQLKNEPLENTTVWAVLSGCEEVGCYGADAFASRHKHELKNSIWIAVDSVGGAGAGVAYLKSETFLLKTKSDPELLILADKVAHLHATLEAYPHVFKSTYTEGAIGGKHGLRVLSLVSFRRDGILPEWHRPTDTLENLDPNIVEHTETFLWDLLKEIDQAVWLKS